jgi:hypothetical protein
MKEKECCGEDCCQDDCCGQDKKREMPVMIMDFANDAWAELMKEKMKAEYEKEMGAKMNKLAHIGVEACIAYWNGQMMEKAKWAEFEEKLKKAMV